MRFSPVNKPPSAQIPVAIMYLNRNPYADGASDYKIFVFCYLELLWNNVQKLMFPGRFSFQILIDIPISVL